MPVNFVAKAAITVGLTALNYALTASRKIEGPRLDDLNVTSGDYGSSLANIWGTRRVAGQIFHAEPLTEVKRQRKTKGGKFNQYTYFGTFAFAVAGHEIAAVRRVWFDKHLVLDLSGTGPVTPFDFVGTPSGGKNSAGSGAGAWLSSDYFRVYLGTETQDPDPRMQSYIEDLHGIGACPAYRGTAYIMVEALPLEKFGNRIPQIEAEIVSVVNDLFPSETLTIPLSSPSVQFSPDYSTILASNATEFAMIDTAARAIALNKPFSPVLEDSGPAVAWLDDGVIIGVTESGNDPATYDLSGTGIASPVGPTYVQVSRIVGADGEANWLLNPQTTIPDTIYNGVPIDLEELTGTAWFPSGGCGAADGSVWIIGKTNAQTHACFYRYSGGMPTFWSVDMGAAWGSSPSAVAYQDADQDWIVFSWNGVLYALDVATGTIADSYTPVYPTGLTREAFNAMAIGTKTIWCGFEEIDLATLSQVRSLDYRDWVGGGTVNVPTIYDPVNHALIVESSTTALRWCYLDRIPVATVTLGTIAADVAERVLVEDYDYTDLDQVINGWSATRGQAKAMLAPLFEAYDSDQRPHDFGIEGIKRTGVTTGTISTEWLVGEPRYTQKIKQAVELPRSVTINYADLDADQQPNNARADRPLDASGAVGEQSLDMTTLVLDADEAGQLARRYFRRLWNERNEVATTVTAKNLAIEPGDVKTLELDGESAIFRLDRMIVKSDDTIETEWRYDHPSLAVMDADAGAGFDGRADSSVVVPLLSRGFFLDVPYLTDADDQSPPVIYLAAAPWVDGTWPGAVAYQSVDGEYSDEIGSVASSAKATWGYMQAVLPDKNPWLWDRTSSVSVVLQTGTLTGCTEAQADADPSLNLCMIGDEIVQFTTATLTAPLTYTLSGFKRGRRGTEWACSTHGAGEVFLMLDTAQDVALGLSEVGTNLSFKAVTSGRTTGFPVDLEPFTGASLKPYAPTAVRAEKQSNGDWIIYGIRRTRVGGAWTSGTSIPLSEVTEEYQIDLSDGVTDVTKTVTSLPYTWTQAQQATDMGAEVMAGNLTGEVYQISDAVGRGFGTAFTG